jgi:aspartate kinase
MRNVIRIVISRLDEQPVVVISAIARATNELEHIARTAALGSSDEAAGLVDHLFRRHYTIIDELLRSKQRGDAVKEVFAGHQAEIKQLVNGLSILRELTPRTMDAVCSFGERLSSRIIAAGLEEAGVESVWVDAKDFMVTDDNFGRAQPLMDKVKDRLESVVRPLLATGKTPVTQGFIGVTQGGQYTTMGRESSDYSASIIGAAMNARKVQIWTDVDGILSADPRVVARPFKVRRMAFEEAFELSYFGAKVLHPTTMVPLLNKGIPVQILNSKREESTGTLVEVESLPAQTTLKSIAHRRGVSLITVQPRNRFGQYVFWEGIFSVLTKYAIPASSMATSEYSVCLMVDDKAVTDTLRAELGQFGEVEIAGGKTSVTLVGKGLRSRPGTVAAILSALSGRTVHMLSFGASDSSLTMVLDADQAVGAVKDLHSVFFDRTQDTEIFDPIL